MFIAENLENTESQQEVQTNPNFTHGVGYNLSIVGSGVWFNVWFWCCWIFGFLAFIIPLLFVYPLGDIQELFEGKELWMCSK